MPTDSLSLAFAALADPTRRAILAQLAAGGEASVVELAAPFDMSTPAISKHLKVLERAGLVAVGRSATMPQARPRHLVAQPLRAATDWLAHYRPYWESTLDNLEAYVAELKHARDEAKAQVRPRRAASTAAAAKALAPRRPRPR